MKNKSLIGKFLLITLGLGIVITAIWLVFYVLTLELTKRNAVIAAESGSDSMIESVENELLRIEELADNLAHYDRIVAMVESRDEGRFFELGAVAGERGRIIISNADMTDNIVVYNSDGHFYRLKGTISNTALKKAYGMMNDSYSGIVTVTYNRNTYIGYFKKVLPDAEKGGYVSLFLENTYIEKTLNAYDSIDYLGAMLIYGDKIIASSDRSINEDLDTLKESAVFFKEKEIGITGFKLLTYCDEKIYDQISYFYNVSIPVMLFILVAVMVFFVRYITRHMMRPIDSIITGTKEETTKPLEHTGEKDFDGLVDHINEMVGRIEERERALAASEMKYKEAELEKERTLLNLLKKQISAHFTVNTLNAVRALVNKGERETAATICDELSTLLRYANAGEEYISLMDEFYVLEQYAGIMKVRYPGRIETVFDEEDGFENIMIPRMLIQPVLENAIVHGLDGRPGKVEIYSQTEDDQVTVFVKDDGKGMNKEQLEKVRSDLKNMQEDENADLNHIALINVQKRIKMVCGEEYGIEIDSEPGKGTVVKLHFPQVPA